MNKGQIRHVVAIGSGKGGVGKSTATALLAAELHRRGLSVGLLDADITGPSIPMMFHQVGPLVDRGEGIEPAVSRGGIRIISSQFLVDDEQTPVIWRGPLVTRLITQFFGGVNWGPLDYLLIDMPPGTSDVPLTVFQTIPIDGMVFVFTPQDLARLIVKKAMNMARDLHVPLLGVVENMTVVLCPHCGKDFMPFGPSHIEEVSKDYGVPLLGRLPLDPKLSEEGDTGDIEQYAHASVTQVADALLTSIDEAEKRKSETL